MPHFLVLRVPITNLSGYGQMIVSCQIWRHNQRLSLCHYYNLTTVSLLFRRPLWKRVISICYPDGSLLLFGRPVGNSVLGSRNTSMKTVLLIHKKSSFFPNILLRLAILLNLVWLTPIILKVLKHADDGSVAEGRLTPCLEEPQTLACILSGLRRFQFIHFLSHNVL